MDKEAAEERMREWNLQSKAFLAKSKERWLASRSVLTMPSEEP